MRHIHKLAALAAALGLSLVVFAWIQLSGVPDLLQYVAPAPAQEQATAPSDPDADAEQTEAEQQTRRDSKRTERMDALDELLASYSESVRGYALYGYAHGVEITDGKQSSQKVELFAVSESHFSLYPELVAAGRMPYADELRHGDSVIALSQQLAVDLFRISDPTGRFVTLGGQKFRVVGVTRRDRQVGDVGAYRAYVPLRALAEGADGVQLTQLAASVRPIPGSGAEVMLKPALEGWLPGGSYHQLGREKTLALLTPLVLLGVVWLYALIGLARLLARWCAGWVREARERLRLEYFVRLLPGLLLRALLALLGAAALTAVCLLWTRFAARPLLLFPEWVPEVPVEWEEIQKTFWSLQYQASAQAQYFTPESARMGFMASLANVGSILTLCAALLQALFTLRLRRDCHLSASCKISEIH